MKNGVMREVYFSHGKKKLLGYLTELNGKIVLAYVKEGEILSCLPLSELKDEIVKFHLSIKRRASSLSK